MPSTLFLLASFFELVTMEGLYFYFFFICIRFCNIERTISFPFVCHSFFMNRLFYEAMNSLPWV